LEKFIQAIKVLFILGLVFAAGCNKPKTETDASLTDGTLQSIREQGTLTAITDFNSTNYFIYRGLPMGYQYELLKAFADDLQVKLRIVVSNDLEKSFELLKNRNADLLAVNLTVTKHREKTIDFSLPHSQTRQVLVQRKPDNWSVLSQRALEDTLIRNQLELANKVVYVQRNSSYATRIHNLAEEIGQNIHIVEVAQQQDEELIRLVANGDIDYTIADENIAKVNATYFPSIDVETAISFPQNLAWGLRPESDSLRYTVNKWLAHFKTTSRYHVIYQKYFRNSRSVFANHAEYRASLDGAISPYDETFKEESKKIDWDWRLLAALAFQESRFMPHVESWAGAFGLMQLMPNTANRFGVTKKSPVENQIEAGVKFLKWLDTRFVNREMENEEERIKFVLGAYNVGLGHILDARRLAEKYGKDPNIWEGNVDQFILKKSDPTYFTDDVVYYGYCRGEETYRYVHDIIERWHHYQNTK
jgi:membrane-bound lytic murein transglycosylase F